MIFAGVLSLLSAMTGCIITIYLLSASPAMAQKAFFQALGIGMPISSRGEDLRVKGWTILGYAGRRSGQITLMPPDGTGFYSIDNAGRHRLRFSGGSVPGQYEYMTISHPGNVKINGRLQVMGRIVDKNGKPFQSRQNLPPIPKGTRMAKEFPQKQQGHMPFDPGKGDSAGLNDIQVLRDELNFIWDELERIRQRVNVLSQ